MAPVLATCSYILATLKTFDGWSGRIVLLSLVGPSGENLPHD